MNHPFINRIALEEIKADIRSGMWMLDVAAGIPAGLTQAHIILEARTSFVSAAEAAREVGSVTAEDAQWIAHNLNKLGRRLTRMERS
jgi:hypothetical protein